MAILLGQLLIQKGLITDKQLEDALGEQRQTREFLGSILVKRGWISEERLLKTLAEQFEIPFVCLKDRYIDWDLAMSFSSSLIVDRQCLPVSKDETGLTVAITNPLDAEAISQVEGEARGLKIHLILVSTGDMQDALKIYRERLSARIKKLLE